MVAAYKPRTLQEALKILEFNDCTVFAGGTDLMVKKKQWSGTLPCFDKPVLFASEIQELKQITLCDKHLIIGACCTFTQLMDSELVPKFYKEVFQELASPGIRNTATIGGNICNASPAGDSLPLLYALDAKLLLESGCRKTEVSMEDFITGPGRNILKSGEILTGIKIPIMDYNVSSYRKIGARRSTVISKLSFVGLAAIDNKGLQDIRIAFGAVAPTVVRNRGIEEEIVGMFSSGYIDMKEISDYYDILIKPIDDQRSTAAYRREVCKNLLRDFIKSLF